MGQPRLLTADPLIRVSVVFAKLQSPWAHTCRRTWTFLRRLHTKALRSLCLNTVRGATCHYRGLAFLRVVARLRTDSSHERTLVPPRVCVCTSPFAVNTTVGVLDLLTVHNWSELKSFWLIVCVDAPESTTNSHPSGLFEVTSVDIHLTSPGTKNRSCPNS